MTGASSSAVTPRARTCSSLAQHRHIKHCSCERVMSSVGQNVAKCCGVWGSTCTIQQAGVTEAEAPVQRPRAWKAPLCQMLALLQAITGK